MIRKRLIALVVLTLLLFTAPALREEMVCSPAVALAEQAQYLFTGVTNDTVNVRAEASQSSARLDKLQKGVRVNVLGVEQTDGNDWYEVDYGSGKHGYVSGKYVDRQISVAVLNERLDVQELAGLDMNTLLGSSAAQDVPKSGEATVVFEGVGVYSGSFASGKRSGSGTFMWDDGSLYEGQWSGDRFHGTGRLTMADGSVYEGEFYRGSLQKGTVTLWQENGALLERSAAGGKLTRRAKLTFADGTSVEGNVSNGQIDGQVTIHYACGDVYEGAIAERLKAGTGTYTWTDGAHYTGGWKDDQMSGKGNYYFSSDERAHYITGTFAANQPAGAVTYVSAQGIKYETEWADGSCISIRYVR